MKLKIVKDNNPKLRQKSVEVSLPLSQEDYDTLYAMRDYLIKSQDEEYAEKHNIRAGVGLAAPQIGINKRMFAIYYQSEDKLIEYLLVNPKIVESSIRTCALEGGEGCLSVDGEHNGLVHRYYKIVMKAFDALQNKDIEIKATGYDAVVLQHEYDHLSGILFYDRIKKDQPNTPLFNEVIL